MRDVHAKKENLYTPTVRSNVFAKSQHHSPYNHTHVGNCFTGLCTKYSGCNKNFVVAAPKVKLTSGAVKRFARRHVRSYKFYVRNWCCCKEV